MLLSILLAAALQTAPAPEAIEAAPAPTAAEKPETPKQTIERLRSENAGLAAKLARAETVADNARQSLDALRRDAALKDELLALGRQRNADLYKLGGEILDRYRRKGLGSVIAGNEPFLQTSRVALENLVQDYEDKLRAARFTEATLPPSVQARMDAELRRPAEAPAAAPQN